MFGLGLGLPELLVIFLIVMVLFGVGRLGEIGGALGGAISEFREAVTGRSVVEEED